MSNHTFCRALLRNTRQELTPQQRKLLKGAWSYMYPEMGFGEFHVPSSDFYWSGSAHCAYDARTKGIDAWLQSIEVGSKP